MNVCVHVCKLTTGMAMCHVFVNSINPVRAYGLVLDVSCVCVPMLVYLEAWVGDEPGVIAQVGGVVLHHALRFWLTEVLVGRGETTSRQHHSGGLWGKRQEREKGTVRDAIQSFRGDYG